MYNNLLKIRPTIIKSLNASRITIRNRSMIKYKTYKIKRQQKQKSNMELCDSEGEVQDKRTSFRNYTTATSCAIVENAMRDVDLPEVKDSSGICNKVALVTGGSNGIGLQCVRELLGCDVKAVMIADSEEQGGSQVICKLCEEFGENRAAFIRTDIANTILLRNAFEGTVKHFDSVDIVINNAGYASGGSWEKQIDKNIKGIVRGTLLGIEYMGRHNKGNGGVVLNVCTTPADEEERCCPIYNAAKHFIVSFGRAIAAKYFKQTKVKVVTVCCLENNGNDNILSTSTKCEENEEIEPEEAKYGCDLSTIILKGKNGSIWAS